MKIKKSSIVVFVMLGAVFGYPFVAGISATLGLPNSIISIGLRSLVAFAGLFLIVDNLGAKTHGLGRLLLYCTCLFITLFLLRLIYSTILSSTMSPDTANNYWIWTIGSAVLPVLGLSSARSYDLNWSLFQNRALFVVLIASVLVALNMTTTVTDQIGTYDSGRARLETLNPISLGHLGASLLLLTIAIFWQLDSKRGLRALLALIGMAIGAYLTIASNSRGPLVGAAAAICFAWLVSRGTRKVAATLILATAVLTFAPILLWLEVNYGVTTYSRLFGQSFSEETNVVARLDMYWIALSAFGDSPLLGVGLEIKEIGIYPHNVTLEAFLATGLIGGLAFFSMQVLALRISWKVCRAHKDLLWLGMIIVQYIVASQFSGALYASPPLWASIGIAAFAFNATRQEQTPRNRGYGAVNFKSI